MGLDDDKEFRGEPDNDGEADTESESSGGSPGRDSEEPGEPKTPAPEEDDLPLPSQPDGEITGGKDFTELRGYSRREVDGTIEITREFDSWYDFVTTVSNEKLREWKKYYSSHDSNSSFRGTKSFLEAETMALRTGWPEGRKMLHDFMLELQPKPIIRPASEFDVAGMFPCVPIYCAGDPASMFADSETNMRISKPVIKIDFSQVVDCGVPTEKIMLRGAAVLSLVNTLELSGRSVELRLVGGNTGGNYNFFNYITYKPANQPLDLDRAAFAIAHPSTLRRLLFAMWEQHGEIETHLNANYGFPIHSAPPLSKNTIFIPGAISTETPASAKAAVKAAAQSVLKDDLK